MPRRILFLALAFLLLSSFFLLVPLLEARATGSTILVNSLSDGAAANDGNCTLREAITNANNNNQSGSTDCAAGSGADTITFSVNGTITLGAVLPLIADPLTIDGSGHTVTVSGNSSVQVLDMASGQTLNLYNLTIANGLAYQGGGVRNKGTLNVRNCTFSGNKTTNTNIMYSEGGGIYNYDYATLTIDNSTFTNNSSREGAAIAIWAYGQVTITNSIFTSNNATGSNPDTGGAIYNYGTLTIRNSTFSGNTAVFGGGAIGNVRVLEIDGSTFSGNSTTGPDAFGGGAIYNDATSTTVGNSTFTGNSTNANNATGGAIFHRGGNLTVINSTFSGNSSTGTGGSAGGISSITGGSITLENTIIANSTGGNCWVAGSVTTDSHDLADDSTCGSATVRTSAQITLGPLADNGGPTQTLALGAGSVALNAGDPAVCTAAPVNNLDQRGEVRIGSGDAACDVGAYEGNSHGTLTPTSTPTSTSTSTRTSTPTNTPTSTRTPSNTSTPTSTSTSTDTPTRTGSPTQTLTQTNTPRPTKTPTRTPTLPAVLIQEGDYRVQYDGWRGVKATQASGGTFRMSNVISDTVTVAFTGTSCQWITRKGPNQGIAEVILDSKPRLPVDLYSATPVWQAVKTYSGLTNTRHTLVIRVSGNKNPLATDTQVTFDALRVGVTTIQDTTYTVRYNNWIGKASTSASGGSYRINSRGGAMAKLAFNGTGIIWLAAKGPTFGQADLYIDGSKKGTYNFHSAATLFQFAVPVTGLASNRTHTIEVRPVGAGYVAVDAFRGRIQALPSARVQASSGWNGFLAQLWQMVRRDFTAAP